MNSTSSLLFAFSAGAVFGAAVMYVLDPEVGERRRSKALDQVGLGGNDFENMVDDARGRVQDVTNKAQDSARDLTNRTPSTVNEARRELT